MAFGSKSKKIANKHTTKKVSHNPASGSLIRKDGKTIKHVKRLYANAPNGSPASHPLTWNARQQKGGAYMAKSTAKGAAANNPLSIGIKKPSKVDAALYAKNVFKDTSNYRVGNDAWIKLFGASEKKDGKKNEVSYDYSPLGGMPMNYGNVGMSGSSAKSFSEYDFLKYLQESNTATNIAMNQYNNNFAAQQAKIQRDWEMKMSNTAHQREVKDLQAAGLNPILSANAGAAVPSGAAAGASNFAGADSSAINAIAGVIQATLSSNATTTAAALNANAAMYGANQSAAASRYGSKMAYKGAEFTATHGKGTKTIGDIERAWKFIDKLAKQYKVDLGQLYRKR